MIHLNLASILKMIGIGSIAIMLAACSGSDSPDSTNTSASVGTITLGITDAPVDSAEEVVVQFTGVEIISADEGGENQLITFTEAKTIDLLSLQGGSRDLLLNGEELPAGQYGQIRLLVQAEHDTVFDSYITIGGAQHELRVPSGSQTGLKLIHNFELGSDASTDFTIDFDLRKSIVDAGGQGYMLKPVLRLIETESASSISGIIDPIVFAEQTCSDDPLEGYAVYVYEGAGVTPDDLGSTAEPLTTTGVSLNDSSLYAYTVGFLEPATYTVAATCQADQDDPEADSEIGLVGAVDLTVTAGTTTTHDFQ